VIPPFVQRIVSGLIRAAVVALSGYLAGTAKITISEEQIGQVVTYLTPIVAMLAWDFISARFGRQKLLTAAAAAGVTEKEVEQMVADPAVPTPSVMQGKDA